MRILIAGGGGRESAFALKISQEGCVLYAILPHRNPTICQCVSDSGGHFLIGNCNDPQTVAGFAIQHEIDYAFINSDDALANGVVDALLERNIKAIGGTKAATQVEWDKVYAMRLVSALLPEFTPFYRVADNEETLNTHLKEFETKGIEVVVKPQGLTGGKGVKVMPIHLPTYADCLDYGRELLQNGTIVLLVEKVYGVEFTVMGFTDGESLTLCPTSYDYPYRFVGDTGAGTGGMGCYTAASKHLPFMTEADMKDCHTVMKKVIDALLYQEGRRFQGVLNGGFFKTADSIKFMEFNSRFGDPEAMNVLSVLSGSFSDLLVAIWEKQLANAAVNFTNKASVVKYIVAKEYPNASATETYFDIPFDTLKSLGITVFFSSAEPVASGGFKTLRRSRVVALGAVGNDKKEISQRLNRAISDHIIKDNPQLDYRQDIGEDTQAVDAAELGK